MLSTFFTIQFELVVTPTIYAKYNGDLLIGLPYKPMYASLDNADKYRMLVSFVICVAEYGT